MLLVHSIANKSGLTLPKAADAHVPTMFKILTFITVIYIPKCLVIKMQQLNAISNLCSLK